MLGVGAAEHGQRVVQLPWRGLGDGVGDQARAAAPGAQGGADEVLGQRVGLHPRPEAFAVLVEGGQPVRDVGHDVRVRRAERGAQDAVREEPP